METMNLRCQLRDTLGTSSAKRARKAGMVPAVIYGGKEPNSHLLVNTDDLNEAVNKGLRVVALDASGKPENVFFREIKFDVWGSRILHMDFLRIRAGEKIAMQINVRLKGIAVGTKEGGVLEQNLQALDLEVDPTDIPSEILLDISGLKIGDFISVGDIQLPPNITTKMSPRERVVSVQRPAEEEVVSAEPQSLEPEVIGRDKKEDEEEAEE